MQATQKPRGHFVISLDFELYWGMFDKVTLGEYGENIAGVHSAIPKILALFLEYGIHATWATVGMLMCKDEKSLLDNLPAEELRPVYVNKKLSTYEYIKAATAGNGGLEERYHFGADLIELIKKTPGQEIGSHTFSHYYPLEEHERAKEIFAADCDAFAKVAGALGITATAIVFPRNQTNSEALEVAASHGIRCYRGTENHFIYRPRKDDEQSLFIRAFRLLDCYLNLTGHHTYDIKALNTKGEPLINIPSSRFLRPWSRSLRFLEPFRLLRIKRAMTVAAKNGQVFHLWWHPHNFGIDQNDNLNFLRSILEHYRDLQKEYGMESVSMTEATQSTNR